MCDQDETTAYRFKILRAVGRSVLVTRYEAWIRRVTSTFDALGGASAAQASELELVGSLATSTATVKKLVASIRKTQEDTPPLQVRHVRPIPRFSAP